MNDMTAASIANIRSERDRFVAFAFATADTLIETDSKLNIHYATGAVRWLFGHDVAADGSVNFEQSVSPIHLKLFAAACNLGRKEGRFGTLDMVFQQSKGRTVATQMSGTYLPKDGGRF